MIVHGAFRVEPLTEAALELDVIAPSESGLTGTGYDGHCFRDTDLYVLSVLSYTAPYAAADALRRRHSTLPAVLRGGCLHVEVTTHSATYVVKGCAAPVRITHHGQPLTVGGEPVTRPIPPAPERPPPRQHPGREPVHRAPG